MMELERAKRRADALLNAPLDRWIALSEDESEIIAVGSTFDEAAQKAKAQGVSDPIIVKTPEAWTSRVMAESGV
jgi:hypothetical protein